MKTQNTTTGKASSLDLLNQLISELSNAQVKKDPSIRDKKDSAGNTNAQESKITEIKLAHSEGLNYYQNGNIALAEQEFTKLLKPILSKAAIQKQPTSLEDCDAKTKELILDSVKHLGEIYLAKKASLDNYSKAAAIFQYCHKFAIKYLPQNYESGKYDNFWQKAHEVELQFLEKITSKSYFRKDIEEAQSRTTKYVKKLSEIRHQTGENLTSLKDVPLDMKTEAVQGIYANNSKFFLRYNTGAGSTGLIKELLDHCFQQLGNPPKGCNYSIFSLGSLAGGRITPWSDLEFGVLINEDREDFKEYFRNLTKLLHIKVINIGQTPLRSVGIEGLNDFRSANKADDWFWDDLTENGFSFDGPDWHACKLPLGRQGGYKVLSKNPNNGATQIISKPDYELILTIDKLTGFQSREWFVSDPHLVQALRFVSFIDGDQGLLQKYTDYISKSDPRKFQIIKENILDILKQDIDKFQLRLGDLEEGKLFDVKKDIYRISDRIIDGLANYYGIITKNGHSSMSCWEVIDAMLELGKISPEGAQNIKNAFSIAAQLRLSTYFHNQEQEEGLSTYFPTVAHLDERTKTALIQKTFYLKDTTDLHYFYRVMLKTQKLLQNFINNADQSKIKDLTLMDDLIDDSNYTKALIHARFLEYDKAVKFMEIARSEDPKNIKLLESLFLLYHKTEQIKKAEILAEEIVNFYKTIDISEDIIHKIWAAYNNLGAMNREFGKYQEAIKCHELALKLHEQFPLVSSCKEDAASSYNNLGIVYKDIGQYKKSRENFTKSLQIKHEIYGEDAVVSEIISSHTNLGNLYQEMGNFNEARLAFETSLRMSKQFYQKIPNHPTIAMGYTNLGSLFLSFDRYKDAEENFRIGLEIKTKFYQSLIHDSLLSDKSKAEVKESELEIPFVITNYINLASIYTLQCKYDKAKPLYDKALNICKKVYGENSPHTDLAVLYDSLGQFYLHQHLYSKALEVYQKSLEIRLFIHKSDTKHQDIAISYNNLGLVYKNWGQYNEALASYKKAAEAFEGSDQSLNPIAATCKDNIASVYSDMGDFEKAHQLYNDALQMRKYIYAKVGIADHTSIAASISNLGHICHKLSRFTEAKSYFEQAKSMLERIYGDDSKNYSNVADCYNNLATVAMEDGDYELAQQYYTESFNILKNIYGSSPNKKIAGYYNNLSSLYKKQDNYIEALKMGQKALEIYKAIYQDVETPEIAMQYLNIADTLYGLNALQEAEKLLQIVFKISEKLSDNGMNQDNHLLASYYNLTGQILCKQKLYQQAKVPLEKALELQRIIYKDKPHQHVASTLVNLGAAANGLNELEKVLGLTNQALEMNLTLYPSNPNHPSIAACYNNLGSAYTRMGNYEQAIKIYHESLKAKQIAFKDQPAHPDIILTYQNLASAYFIWGNFEKALEHITTILGKASNLQEQALLKDAFPLLSTLEDYCRLQIGNKYLFEGKENEARAIFIQIAQLNGNINLQSGSLIEFQAKQVKFAQSVGAVKAALNAQKAILMLDFECKIANHHHDLACLYAADGDIKTANEEFLQAFSAKYSNSLYVEYAQFLMIHGRALSIDRSEISDNLHKALNIDSGADCLNYYILDKNNVCPLIKQILQQKQKIVSINSKIFAHYLLITNQQYLKAEDKIEKLIESLDLLCHKFQSSLGFKMLAEAYRINNNPELAKQCFDKADQMDKLHSIADNEVIFESVDKLKQLNNLQELAEYMTKTAKLAVDEKHLHEAQILYSRLCQYDQAMGDQVQYAINLNNLATVSLMYGDYQKYNQIKMHGGKINRELFEYYPEAVWQQAQKLDIMVEAKIAESRAAELMAGSASSTTTSSATTVTTTTDNIDSEKLDVESLGKPGHHSD